MNTNTVTIALSFQSEVLQDILTHWTDQATTVGVLSQGLQIGASSLSLATTPPTAVKVGQTLLIDQETVVVTSVDGVSVGVGRGLLPESTPANHSQGAQVYLLRFPTPLAELIAEPFISWTNGIVTSLAAQGRSAALVPPTGTVSIT